MRFPRSKLQKVVRKYGVPMDNNSAIMTLLVLKLFMKSLKANLQIELEGQPYRVVQKHQFERAFKQTLRKWRA